MTVSDRNFAKEVCFVDDSYSSSESGVLYLFLARDEIQLAILVQGALVRLSRFPVPEANSLLQFRLALKAFLQHEPMLQRNYEHVHLLFAFPIAHLIPESFFEEHLLESYIRYSSNVEQPVCYHQHIPAVSCELAFAIQRPFVDLIRSHFPRFSIRHAFAAFIQQSLQKVTATPQYLVHLRPPMADLLVYNAAGLEHYNQIYYQSPEDLLYFTLNHMTRSGLVWGETPISILGASNTDEELKVLRDNGAKLQPFDYRPDIARDKDAIQTEALNNFAVLLANLGLE